MSTIERSAEKKAWYADGRVFILPSYLTALALVITLAISAFQDSAGLLQGGSASAVFIISGIMVAFNVAVLASTKGGTNAEFFADDGIWLWIGLCFAVISLGVAINVYSIVFALFSWVAAFAPVAWVGFCMARGESATDM